eukprot:8520175-Alexandrium_andersonii.AAC.1
MAQAQALIEQPAPTRRVFAQSRLLATSLAREADAATKKLIAARRQNAKTRMAEGAEGLGQ